MPPDTGDASGSVPRSTLAMTDDRRLSDEQARRLWQRAAELQAEAARSLEERSQGLARESVDEDPGTGYSLAHVRQAAVEAGISPEFVDLAIDEAGDDLEREEGLAGRIVGDGPRVITVSRIYDHPAARIFASMQRVLPQLRLNLVDTRGEPMEGGWMHFELPAVGLQDTHRVMVDLYHWADVRELHFRLVPLGDDRCEVTVRAPLGYSRKLGGWVFGGLAPVGGLLAALLTGAVTASIVSGLALAPLVEALLPWFFAAGAFGGGTAAGLKGLRTLARSGWAKGEAALERLLGTLAMDARTGGAFQPAPPPPTPPSSVLPELPKL